MISSVRLVRPGSGKRYCRQVLIRGAKGTKNSGRSLGGRVVWENVPIDVLSSPVPPSCWKVTFKEGTRRYSENLLDNQASYPV